MQADREGSPGRWEHILAAQRRIGSAQGFLSQSMPWGGSEKHQSAYKRGQASKGLSPLYAPRLQRSIHFLLNISPTCGAGNLWLTTDYGVVELNLHWAHPLEMLSFGQGDLIVTLCHWWRNHIQIYRQLPRRTFHHGKACWEGTLKTTEEHDRKWRRTLKTSALLTAANCKAAYKIRKKATHKQKSNQEGGHYWPEPFMGRGSQCVTTPPWSSKVTFWTLAVSLLLLSVMTTTGSPTPATEGQSNTEKESDSFGTADHKRMDLFIEDNVERSIKSPKVPIYGNTTSGGRSDDELPDNVLFRAERSSRGHKKKNRDCRLHSILVYVQDLGLGYESDEKISINYCVGTCKKSANYDLALSTLLKNNHIEHSSQRRVSSQPCCRPTKYGTISFQNKQQQWQIIDNVTAISCSCGG